MTLEEIGHAELRADEELDDQLYALRIRQLVPYESEVVPTHRGAPPVKEVVTKVCR